MVRELSRYKTVFLLMLGILTIFIGRTLLATAYPAPRLSDIFEIITVIGSVAVCIRGYGYLKKSDWVVAIALGALVGVGMCFATLFTPYPAFGIVRSNPGHAMHRGIYAIGATLGGLVITRRGGPVQFHIANKVWRQSGKNIVFGLLIGLPLSILNVIALKLSEGKPLILAKPSGCCARCPAARYF